MKIELTRLDFVSWGAFAMFATSGVVTPICLPEISDTLSTTLSALSTTLSATLSRSVWSCT